jgi:hypothetical protein
MMDGDCNKRKKFTMLREEKKVEYMHPGSKKKILSKDLLIHCCCCFSDEQKKFHAKD